MKKFGIGATLFSFLSFFLVASLLPSTALHAQAPFYQGKNIASLSAIRPVVNMIFGRATSPTI